VNETHPFSLLKNNVRSSKVPTCTQLNADRTLTETDVSDASTDQDVKSACTWILPRKLASCKVYAL